MAWPELHFGAALGLDVADTVVEARMLEDLGYDYVASGEHIMRGNPPAPSSLALPVLAVAAGATTTIRLLSSVVLLPFYHPTLLAKLTPTLDLASRGRLTLGVGVGGEYPVEFDATEVPVGQRGRRSDECLQALKLLWTGEGVDFQGRHYRVRDVTIAPPPQQRPHPPVWVGGRREAAMGRAVRYGDGWYPYFYSPERYAESVATIKRLADDEGRDLAGFELGLLQFISIYDSHEKAMDAAVAALGPGYQYSGDYEKLVSIYCVLGDVKSCIRRLEEYVQAGARHIIFSWACPPEDQPRHMEAVAEGIIPHFRS